MHGVSQWYNEYCFGRGTHIVRTCVYQTNRKPERSVFNVFNSCQLLKVRESVCNRSALVRLQTKCTSIVVEGLEFSGYLEFDRALWDTDPTTYETLALPLDYLWPSKCEPKLQKIALWPIRTSRIETKVTSYVIFFVLLLRFSWCSSELLRPKSRHLNFNFTARSGKGTQI